MSEIKKTADNDCNNHKGKKGFSGLSDLVSDVSSIHERQETPPSEPKAEPTLSPPPIEAAGSEKSSGGFRVWILGMILFILVVWLINDALQSDKETSDTPPSSSQTHSYPQSTPGSPVQIPREPIGIAKILNNAREERELGASYQPLYPSASPGAPRKSTPKRSELIPWNEIVVSERWAELDDESRLKVFNGYMRDLEQTPEWQALRGDQKFKVTQGIMRDGGLEPMESVSPSKSTSSDHKKPTAQYTREAQQLLTDLGYDPGPTDGQHGRRTAEAVKAFQRDMGIAQDGCVDQNLLSNIKRLDPTICSWYRDPEFRALSSDRRKKVIVNYFNSRKLDDRKFKALDLEQQKALRSEFLQFHVDFFEQKVTQDIMSDGGLDPKEQPIVEQSLPASGVLRTYTNAKLEAPFQIKAAQGSHYLLKLVDAHTFATVLTVFVRGGTTVDIDVPLGSYEIRYASGKSWYGYEHLFGQDTVFSKADKTFTFNIVGNQIRGFEITLYAVANGNLHTSKISPKEF